MSQHLMNLCEGQPLDLRAAVEAEHKNRRHEKKDEDAADLAKKPVIPIRAGFPPQGGCIPFRLYLIWSNIHAPICMHLSCQALHGANRR